MANFFRTRSVKNNATNHRIAAQLWSEVARVNGRSDGDLPAYMSGSPRGIQLTDRHRQDGMSVYIRELDDPHRILAYPVRHSDLRTNVTSETRLDWAALAKIVEGGRPIVVSGDIIQIDNASVDISRAMKNPEYLEMVSRREEVIDRFGSFFLNPTSLTEAAFQEFLLFENNHHWTGLHRQAPNLMEQGIEHLRTTISMLTDESSQISERYNAAVGRQKGMSKGIATAILLVAFPDKYGVWNTTSEAGLIELGFWPELPRGTTAGETYESVNASLHRLAKSHGVDLWSIDGLLHFILHPTLEASSAAIPSNSSNQNDNKNTNDKKTDSPSTVLNLLGHDGSHGTKFWWVNNKQTYTHEIGGNYLWSPTERSDGVRNEFYENMKRIRPGDIVFAFSEAEIRAVGICAAPAVMAPKPGEFGHSGDNWGDEGWRVAMDFTVLNAPLRPKDHLDVLAPTLPKKYSPIQPNGNGNQGAYLAAVPFEMARVVIKLLGPRWSEIDLSDIFAPVDLLGKIEELEVEVERVILNRTDLSETEKLQLVKSRRGQGIYRKNLEGFEKVCRITGVRNLRHLRASHIKPWRASTTFEKLDGNNGILLSPHVDHLFDQGFISFADDGTLLTSTDVDFDTLALWGIKPEGNFGDFRPEQLPYLDFHREVIFKK
ncbi:HNH endonuclease [Sulfitobacter brevis]|uniref:HNH endonuclease n=1 Tax=Sulfitobacter brevis TaxID=74348 RepID=A0A1I2GL39_9RHOB|nr:HNH endonuclease signature motif containing protein [Sulfitobacter brevis]SFF17943.1 HNH endonuclease [Sulfitobacter brevis]